MSRPRTLLVLSPSTGGYYFGALLGGIVRELADSDGRAVVVQTLEPGVRSDEIGEPPDFSVPVAWETVDGAVSITSAAPATYLSALEATGRPVVLASNRLRGFESPSAVPDNAGGTAAVVEHLLAHGHTRVGFVGNLAQRDIRERHTAYVSTLEAHGLEARTTDLYDAPENGESGGRTAAQELLRSTDRPAALMVATDRNAIGLLDHLRAEGVDVPGEVAVVAFDNIEASSFCIPPLTTVDQPFDQVGALAARLVLARLGGTAVPDVPHPAPASVTVRSSCGCDPFGVEGGTAVGRRRPSTIRAIAEERLRRTLQTGVPAEDRAIAALVTQVIAEVDLMIADGTTTEEVETLGGRLRRAARRPHDLRAVTRALDEYVRAMTTTERAAVLLAGLRDIQAAAFLLQASRVESMLEEQFGVDSGLLEAQVNDPRSLAWLAGTHVRSAVLATRSEDGELTIAAVHDPGGVLPNRPGDPVVVEHFPPPELVDLALPGERLVCYVLPVRTRKRDWGLLALVAEIEVTSARETYHHWATLLASALEQQALQAAVTASEERHSLAAQATHDGLWELDLRTRELYLSDRCREILGLDGEAGQAEWNAVIVPEHRDAVAEEMGRAARASETPSVEIEYRVRHADGERWVLSRALGVAGGGRVERLVGSLSDIHPRKELEEQLRRGAFYDTVTGLPNRRHFRDRLVQALDQAARRPDSHFAVVFLDLDGFKLINDSLGHLMGDELLATIGRRLQADLRAVDTAARFGGDEFAVLLSDPVPDEVLAIAQRIQERIAEPVMLGENEVEVTASVGIATSESGYTDADDVLRDADTAMYHAKGTERGTASIFDPVMHARATGRLKARSELRTALAAEQFVVHYQPVVALDGAAVTHFEALVRWEHPERGLLLPGTFLPDMEDNGSIVALGAWMLDQVCAQLAAWRAARPGTVTVAVNLSHREFWADSLLSTVTGCLTRHDVPATALALEITESVIMAEPTTARIRMNALRDLGLSLHIDDFGTGHSSLGALRSFPVDTLKIDGSFIRELETDHQTAELVKIIVAMGATLGMDVVAECVETPAQAQHLTALGCHNAQGWLYAHAVPADQAQHLLGRPLTDRPLEPGGALRLAAIGTARDGGHAD